MYLFCNRHNGTHQFTAGELERVVYALSCALAIAETEDVGDDREHAGEDAMDHFPCPQDMLRAADCGEQYREQVDADVDSRRVHAGDWAQIMRTTIPPAEDPLPLEITP